LPATEPAPPVAKHTLLASQSAEVQHGWEQKDWLPAAA
jgi:hypothetical protein